MFTSQDYTLHYKVGGTDYGQITVPKGTSVTHETSLGIDKNYHFVNDLSWVDENYSSFANILKHDITYYGINVPKEYVEK